MWKLFTVQLISVTLTGNFRYVVLSGKWYKVRKYTAKMFSCI